MEHDEGVLLTKLEKQPAMSFNDYGSFNLAYDNTTEVLEAIRKVTLNTKHATSSGGQVGVNGGSEVHAALLTVIGLSYQVKDKAGQWWNGSCCRDWKVKTVLRDLCMTFNQGEITALVGGSGSGKTSLLDVIAGRATGQVSGVVSYKHKQCTVSNMKQISSYVLQADRLLPTLTVRETLTYMAYLSLPRYLSSEDIHAKVESVMASMGLRHVADSRIGGAVVRGVSGGEKRRITIGVQLLKDPDILLLDEPTSGLDAFTARQLVASLADLAHRGKLVILSIHQPRSDIFYLLDKVAILTVGQLAFFGRPDQMVPYFTSIGFPCPTNRNPCDVYIDITSVDRRNHHREKTTLEKVESLCQTFSRSDLQAQVLALITKGLNYHYDDDRDFSYRRGRDGPTLTRKFRCLLSRMNTHLWRDRGAFLGRFLMLPFFVPFILIFLGRLGLDQESIQNRLGLIYQASQVPTYIGLTNAVALFPVLRSLFYREHQCGLYSTWTFLLTYYVHCLPFNIVSGAAFASCLYWIAGLNDNLTAFGIFLLVIILLVQFGEMTTISILAVCRDVHLANNTATLVFSASGLLASGLLRSVGNMPRLLQWVSYLPVHKYAAQVIVADEFHNLNFTCLSHLQESSQCLRTGDQYLDMFYSDAYRNVDRNLGILGGYSVAVVGFCFIMFKLRGVPSLH